MTIKIYNKLHFGPNTQNVLLVRFVCYAKRLQKNTFFLRGFTSHTLWRDVVDSAFLQQDQTKETIARMPSSDFCPKNLSFFRISSVTSLLYCYGASTHQQDRDITIQWCIPGDAWTGPFSGSIHSASFSIQKLNLTQKFRFCK
jgi:hypothetical protein